MHPTARRTQDERREATRTAVVDAAVALFAQKGAQGATLQDVAVAAGLSKGAVTYHFTTKDALVDAALARCAELLVEAVIAAESDPDAAPGFLRLRRVLDAVWRPFALGRDEARVLADLAALARHDPRLAPALSGGCGALEGVLARALQRCADALGARLDTAPESLAHLVLAVSLGASLTGATPASDEADDPAGDTLLRLVAGRFTL